LKKVVVTVQIQGQDYDVKEVDVDKVVPGPVPESEFTLAAFGLGDAEPGRIRPFWILLNVAGILLIVAAIVVRRWANRKRAQSTAAG
jgi:hypothetical protein